MEAVGAGMGTRLVQQRTFVIGIAGAAILALVVGVFIGRGSGLAQNENESPAPPAAGPRAVSNGVPVGYARTEEGAVVAATNFSLVSTSDLVRDRDALIAGMETLAAPSWKESARSQAENGHEFAVEHYGPDVRMTTSVLRYQSVSFTPDAATVRLWGVTVASGSERPEAEAVWGTSTLNLEWIEGDWRVSGAENETGPAPAALQSPTDDPTLENLLEEFSDFAEGPRP